MAITARTLSTMINTMPRRRETAFRNVLIELSYRVSGRP
jgi:hypothetical protein